MIEKLKITLKDIKEANLKYKKALSEYNLLSVFDKLYSNKGNKINRLLKKYKKLKNRYFYGLN